MIKHPVLDLGCGDGFFAEIVWGKGKIDVGLDLPNKRTKKIEKTGIYKKISYFNGIKIPYKDNFFQTVVSNCVLEHVGELPELLKEVNRVLSSGGFFLASVMCDKWEEYLWGTKVIGAKYKNYMRKKQDHRNLYSLHEWETAFRTSGFQIEKEIGYLSRFTSRWMDFFHYVSLPELISYQIFGKWVLFPQIIKKLKIDKLVEKLITYPKKKEESAALFFVLSKK